MRLVTGLAIVAIGCFLIFPRTAPGGLIALAALISVAGANGFTVPALAGVPTTIAAFLALAVWAAVSTVWAADRTEAIAKSLMLLAFTCATWWGYGALAAARPQLLRHAGWTMLVAFGVGLAFLAQEEITGHTVKRLLFFFLPFTRPDAKHIVDADNDLLVAPYISNRNMAAAMLALWPMLSMVQSIVQRRWRLGVSAGLVALAVVTFAISKHETSSIALVASLLVFAVGSRWPKLALYMVAAGWLAATLLMVPLTAWALHGAQLQSAQWLPNSARHRIVLWGYTAERVQQHPLIGVGAASTKALDSRRGPKVDVYPGTPYQWRSGTHAHNVYLQTWYELGGVGALVLCAAGLALIAAIAKLPRGVVPFAAACLVSSAAMGASSWGMWQEWFVAAFGISAVLMGFAIALATSADAERSEYVASPARAPSA